MLHFCQSVISRAIKREPDRERERERNAGNGRDGPGETVRKLLDNGERTHPSIILTRVFMAAGLAYTISNPIFGERPSIGETSPRRWPRR